MTEDEAKQKWCPMVRTDIIDITAIDISGLNRIRLNTNNCIGSACMMWEQHAPYYRNGTKMTSMEGFERMRGADRDGWELIAGGNCGLKT